MLNTTINILVVDDDDGDRMLIKRALKKAGISSGILEARDIDEALQTCEENPVDCVILDYQMPGKSGLEGTKLLHEKFPFLAIVMVTGQGDELLAAEAFKVGATDYIPKKTIDATSIKQIILNAIEKSSLKRKVDEQYHELKLFSYVLAHDLRSPIMTINGLINVLKETLQDGSQEDVDNILNLMEETGTHVEQLVKELTEYNAVQEDEIVMERVSMANVVEQVKNNLKTTIDSRNARVTCDDLPDVEGNEPLLVQLMQNLVQNGIKYCKNELPHVHIYSEVMHLKDCICVADNGIGIAKDKYDKIFEPFKRLVTRSEFMGTGLGLATCKKIVGRHNGKIWCQSELDQGSVFRFVLGSG